MTAAKMSEQLQARIRDICEEVALAGIAEPVWQVGGSCSVVNLLLPAAIPGCRTAVLVVDPAEELNYLHVYDSLRGTACALGAEERTESWHEALYGRLRESGASLPSLVTRRESRLIEGSPVLHLATKAQVAHPVPGKDLFARIAPDLVICCPVRGVAVPLRVTRYVAMNACRAVLWRWS